MSQLKDLMLVGSMRLDTAEEVFRRCGAAIGGEVSFLPDGEVGDRRNFIMHLARRVYLTHPDIEVVTRPAPVDGLRDTWRAASFRDNWRFRIRPGVDEIRFGDPGWRLGYAEAAIQSYFVFRTLREKGLLPAELRFQVTLPLAGYGCYTFFPDPADWPRIVPAYEAAMRAEIVTMAEKIPPADLVIQFDQVSVFDWNGSSGGDEHAMAMNRERYGAAIAALAPAVPAETLLGFHLCYGGLQGWPSRRPPLAQVIDSANLTAQSAGRRIDYIHLPLLPEVDDDYYAPLGDLVIGEAKLFLGVIHGMDDVPAFRRRIARAARYRGDFGIAPPCGTRAFAPDRILGHTQQALRLFRDRELPA